MGRTDAGGKGAGALAGDVYESIVGSELIECGQQAFRFGDKLVVVVGVDGLEHVVDA